MSKELAFEKIITKQVTVMKDDILSAQDKIICRNSEDFVRNTLVGCNVPGYDEHTELHLLSRLELVKHPRVHLNTHPMIAHKLSLARDKKTATKAFQELIEEIAVGLTYEATADLPLEEYALETPVCMAVGKRIGGKKLATVPIFRAGLGIYAGANAWLPATKTGHLGLFRKHDLTPEEYFYKMPKDCSNREVFLLDPMLATGGSAVAAIQKAKDRGCSRIIFICIVAVPEGINAILLAHPDVDIYTAAIDPGLNDHGYIVPGLGDAGDRLFGTK